MQSAYRVKYQETIYDLAILLYGDLSYMFKLMQDNPAITNLNFDFDANAGLTILYDPKVKKPPQTKRKTSWVIATNVGRLGPNIGQFTAVFGQNLYDVCMMTYGSLDQFQKLISDNNIGNSDHTDITGKVFKFDTTLIKDVEFYNYLKDTGYVIATAAPPLGTVNRAHDLSFNISFN